jgi:hypothetical protein
MKITDIKFIKRIVPNGSSGTGYSEPDVFEVTFDNGFKTECLIDCWYRPDERKVFVEAICDLAMNKILFVDNIEEAYQMYKEEKIINGVS